MAHHELNFMNNGEVVFGAFFSPKILKMLNVLAHLDIIIQDLRI